MSRTKNTRSGGATFALLRSAFDSDSDDDAPTTPVAAAPAAPAGGASYTPLRLNNYEKPWVLFDEVDSTDLSRQPCRCCSTHDAFDDNPDFWTCQTTGRRWLVVGEQPDMTRPHIAELCLGNCPFHPLMNGDIARWQRANMMNVCWSDLLQEEQEALDALKSPEQLAAERAAAEVMFKEAMHKTEVACAASHIRRVQEAQAYKYAARGKIYEPCKKLYSCDKAVVKGRELAVPTTLHVSSECWRYIYTDPETGHIHAPKTCNWLHPGEDGWQDEWDTDRNSKAAAERAKALAAADPNQNRFANLAGQERGGAKPHGGARGGGGGFQKPHGGGGGRGGGGAGGFQKPRGGW